MTPHPESVRTMRGIIIGLFLAVGFLWLPLGAVIITAAVIGR